MDSLFQSELFEDEPWQGQSGGNLRDKDIAKARNKKNDVLGPVPTVEQLENYLAEYKVSCVSPLTTSRILNGYLSEIPYLFYKGNVDLLDRPCVSVVGTRTPSAEGKARAAKVVEMLVELGIVVVSGLAKGIDTVAHETTLKLGGLTVAVLGTPIHKIYPAENRNLSEKITTSGLLLSPSLPHQEHGRYLFPRRNRLMALMSRATIIIEAGPTSGVIHQAAECLRQNRKLVLLKSLAENTKLPWIPRFLNNGAIVVNSASELKDVLA